MKLQKAPNVKIISITTFNSILTGLGDDGSIYEWSSEKNFWYVPGIGNDIGKATVTYRDL